MSIDKHVENRAWTFQGLNELQEFLEDPDFEGDRDEERVLLERKRTELQDSRYRVVFLGAFNVGKSTLINAFLGDEYLPTILEECTTKITHVVRGDEMKLVLRLNAETFEEEVNALGQLLAAAGINATVERSFERNEVVIQFPEPNASALLQTLRSLTTMTADEDYPQLRHLRGKFEEVFVHLPNDRLEEDIALVDSPGVHSISETNTKVAHDIIPDSHLVICMIDSQNAGNEQSREFIESIIKHRHRKVFFVINKSDHLNPEEIDPSGRRGPAKDLLRSLEGIVEGPELFFVSSLYALVAGQLQQGKMRIEHLENNNKVRIPFGMHRQLLDSANPAQGAADYLLERSNFQRLKNRLLDYLYTENKEGAVVQSVSRFIDARAWKYRRPIEVKLEMARNIPRLDELQRTHDRLSTDLQQHRSHMREVLQAYDKRTDGGKVDGVNYLGYEALVDEQFEKNNVEQKVRRPLAEWIHNPDKFRDARGNGYRPLTTEMEQRIDAFLADATTYADMEADNAERRTLEMMGAAGQQIERRPLPTDITRPQVEPFRVSMAGSYLLFMIIGIISGGGIGALVGNEAMKRPDAPQLMAQAKEIVARGGLVLGDTFTATPENGALAGAIVGGIIGLILGLFFRAASANGVRRRKLSQQLQERVDAVLLKGSRNSAGRQTAAAREQLRQSLIERRTAFRRHLERAFEQGTAGITEQINGISGELDQLRQEQQAVIARLEPKIARLDGLGAHARQIADNGAAPTAPQEAVY